ncbi:MAG: ankyrin repeat domain-containing protein [Sphingomicrobium sp.]
MNRLKVAAAALAIALPASPALAQSSVLGSDFISAVRSRDGTKAMDLLREKGKIVLNTRDDRGETPLNVAISRRDDEWTGFLLSQGADPNLPGLGGDTPLIAAARVGFEAAVGDLIRLRVKIDSTNRMGETPLIVAVQQRQSEIVKLLLAAGANPDKADSAAGLTARDYAKRDNRTREIIKLIETKKPKP